MIKINILLNKTVRVINLNSMNINKLIYTQKIVEYCHMKAITIRDQLITVKLYVVFILYI